MAWQKYAREKFIQYDSCAERHCFIYKDEKERWDWLVTRKALVVILISEKGLNAISLVL